LTFRVLGGKSGKIAARNGNEVARWVAKTARFRCDSVMYTPSCSWVPAGDGVVFAHGMRLFKVLAAGVAP